ncbi:unnamed protein product [Heterobilharzia americana]|nr:unnamed protein product [Heterobilharzia americana]
MGSTNSLAFVCSTNLRRISHVYLNTSVSHRSSEVKWAVEPISRRCGLLGSVLSQRLHHHYTLIITGKQIKCSSSESSEKLLSNTATNEDITDEKMKCFDKASSYRFVPSRPIWKRFDVGLQNELDQETDVSKIEDPMSSDNYDGEESVRILEEAIRYADSLLTKEAFYGTTNDQRLSPDSIEPIISLCDEINPDFSCPLDTYVDEVGVDSCSLASDIMYHVPDAWEGYIVAPLGNIPVDQKKVNPISNHEKILVSEE